MPARYIVLLKEDSPDTQQHLDWLQEQGGGFGAESDDGEPALQLDHQYDAVKGYAALLSESNLEMVKKRSDVDLVVEDTPMHFCTGERLGGNLHTEKDQEQAPWGLQRISSEQPLPRGSSPDDLTYNYRWGAGQQETPVNVYVIDSGVRIDHKEFGGRATWGKTFGASPGDEDRHGHGTHVAGTIAGERYGVAKNAKIKAVKVSTDGEENNIPTSDIIAGLNWAIEDARQSGCASVVNMSLGGGANPAMDRTVARAVRQGMHVCVAAGNDSMDASNRSPARSPDAITVGATNIKEELAWFSNYGGVVDILAPGERVVSAGIASPEAQATKNGTSMATPHVSGVLAWWIGIGGNRSPAELREQLKKLAAPDKISRVRSGTVNLLLNNGV